MHCLSHVTTSLLFITLFQARTGPDTSTYRNNALHFTYNYPSEFTLTPQVAETMQLDTQARVPEPYKNSIQCVTTPFAAEHQGALNSVEALLIIRSDLTCLKNDPALRKRPQSADSKALIDTARGSLQQGLIKFPSPVVLDPVIYKLGSHDAAFVQGWGSNGPARSGYSGVVCVALDYNIACWAAFTPSKYRIPILLSTTVALSSEDAVPIVPASLLTSDDRSKSAP